MEKNKKLVKKNKLMKNKVFVGVISLLVAFLSVFAFAVLAKVHNPEIVTENAQGSTSFLFRAMAMLRYGVAGRNFIFTIAFGFLWRSYFLFFNKRKEKLDGTSLSLAIVFSLIYLVGMSYQDYNSGEFLFAGRFYVIQALLIFSGICPLFYMLLKGLYGWINKEGTLLQNKAIESKKDKSFFILCFILLLLCWAPHIWAFYPGSLPYDSFDQLTEILGYRAVSANNPVLVTGFMGAFFSIGRFLANDNLGVFLYIVFQACVCAGAFSAVALRAKRLGFPLYISIGLIAFYGLLPIWTSGIQTMVKDMIHTGFFTWFMLEYTSYLFSEKPTWRQITLLIFSMVLASLTRKTAFYVIVLSAVFLLIWGNRFLWKKNTLILGIIVIAFFGTNYLLFPALKVEPPSSTDNYSLIFQQTALYAIKYGDELTEEEKETINQVLDYDEIIEKYDPHIADPVKSTHRGNAEDMKTFLKLWGKMFFRHPDAYIQATLNNAYGYFYPNHRGTSSFMTYIAKNDLLDVHYIHDEPMRMAFINYYQMWKNLPVVYMFLGAGIYSWLILIAIGQGIKKKNRKLILATLPPLFLLLGCVLSPVNGETRYAMPFMATTPILLLYTVFVGGSRKRIEKESINKVK